MKYVLKSTDGKGYVRNCGAKLNYDAALDEDSTQFDSVELALGWIVWVGLGYRWPGDVKLTIVGVEKVLQPSYREVAL